MINPPPKKTNPRRWKTDQGIPLTDVFSSYRVDDDTQLANLDVYGGSEDFDMSLDDIDMNAFMDLDDLDLKSSVKKEERDPVTSRKPHPKTTFLRNLVPNLLMSS